MKTFIADKETLDKCYAILSEQGEYGFIEHYSTLSPSARIEYIGINKNYTPLTINKTTGEADYGSWGDFQWLTANKPYMVKSDGTPDYMLDENDYTKREDGTDSDVANTDYDGGAFAWAQKIYKYEQSIGDGRIVKFSFEKKDGFEPVGFVDPDGNELEGVWLPMFYGSIVDSKMRSLSGLQPCYNNTTDAEHTAIQTFGTRAHHFGGGIMNTLIDLMIMFAKTTNTQSAYGSGNSSGYDASLTPTMGVKQNAVVGGGQFYGTSTGKALNKIFHSVVLGTYQQWMRDPYLLLVNGRYKVSKNYTYDLTGETYIDTGITLPKILKDDGSENTGAFYPHKYQVVPGYGAVPVYPYKGSTSMGGCDALYQKTTITAVALRFGYCNHGSYAGARALILYNTAGNAGWACGAAALLLPPVGVAV
jgi:hypothetical protein